MESGEWRMNAPRARVHIQTGYTYSAQGCSSERVPKCAAREKVPQLFF